MKEDITPKDNKVLEQERQARYKERAKQRKKLKNNLMDQLEHLQIDEFIFQDMVQDYLSLWDIKNELVHDIEEKGVSVLYQNGPEQWGYKKNESVLELNRVNSQMLKLLKQLKIKPVPVKPKEVDDGPFEL